MAYETITKPEPETFAVRPNLDDYERIRTSFDYERVIDRRHQPMSGGLV